MKKSAEEITESLSRILNQLRKSEEFSFVDILEMIASAVSCDFATYWMIDSKTQVLREARTWSSPSIRSEKLRSDSAKRSFDEGEGMPGKAWKYKRAFVSNDLQMDMSLPRSLDANGAGLKSGIWLPIMTDLGVLGIVELLRRDQIMDIDELTRFLEKFASEAGSELHSKSSLLK